MKQRAYILSCLAAVVLAVGVASASAFAATATINTTQLLDKVAAAKGRVVVVNFFAAFCPPCRKEIPGLIQCRTELPAGDFDIIGVAVDEDLAEMEAFIAKTGFNYPVFRATPDLVAAFRVDGIPHNVIYDRKGRMVYNAVGYVPEARFRRMVTTLIEEK